MNKIFIALIALVLIGGGLYYYLTSTTPTPDDGAVVTPPETDDTPLPVEPDGGIGDGAEPLTPEQAEETVIGTSADGNPITAYHFGTGDTELLFVGGAHGGYSFNTALVGYELVDWLDANPRAVPDNVTVTVIPVLNPDGLEAIAGTYGRFEAADVTADDAARTPGRFNGNEVDLNRNFDCEWQPEGTWQNRTVSGGSAPFSEPETAALRDYVAERDIAAAVAWYSAAGGVYSSTCTGDVSAETAALTTLFADAAGYPAYEAFDYYEITGDMVNWLAKEGIPAISVLLTTHENPEWSKNRAGIEAMLDFYGTN